MTWFRVDDTLAFHPKVLAAGNPAIGLWVRAGSWSSQQLTDGHIPEIMATNLGGTRQANQLVDAGLWIPDQTGYQFHEWNLHNPSRSEVEQRREAGAKRLRQWREQRALDDDT